MARPMLLAIDQGTSGTKAILVDAARRHPRAWLCAARRDASPTRLGGAGPDRHLAQRCNRRSRPVWMARMLLPWWRWGSAPNGNPWCCWDRLTGEPLTPVLSWQDQRTAALCDRLRSAETERLVRARSGLPLDPMFSAVKAAWLLQNHRRCGQRRARWPAGYRHHRCLAAQPLRRRAGDRNRQCLPHPASACRGGGLG